MHDQSYLSKIVELEEMASIRRSAAAEGKRCVLAHGIFDIIHPGHTRHLEWARRQGDLLLVTVVDDGLGVRTRTPADIRVENLCALSMVDYVARVRSIDATASVDTVRPDVLVRGMEFQGSRAEVALREKAAVERHGGELLLSSGDPAYSNIRTAELEGSYLHSRETVLHQVLDRHRVAPGRVDEVLRSIDGARVVVVGDSTVEEYVHADALGMAMEDPVIVVKPRRSERFLGGAAGVAEHASSLGARVDLFSVVGEDPTAEFLRRKSESSVVRYHLLSDDTRPTTLKQRFLGGGKKLLRANYFEEHPIRDRLADRIHEEVAGCLDGADLLLFWDGSYGAVPARLRDLLLSRCREIGVPVAATSPCSTQISTIERFRGVRFIVATEREVRMACWDNTNSLAELGHALVERTGNGGLVVPLGEDGALVFDDAGRRDWLPGLSSRMIDPLGGTDALFAATALGIAAGGSLLESSIIGCAAWAVEVELNGNVPVQSDRVRERLLEQLYAEDVAGRLTTTGRGHPR